MRRLWAATFLLKFFCNLQVSTGDICILLKRFRKWYFLPVPQSNSAFEEASNRVDADSAGHRSLDRQVKQEFYFFAFPSPKWVRQSHLAVGIRKPPRPLPFLFYVCPGT